MAKLTITLEYDSIGVRAFCADVDAASLAKNLDGLFLSVKDHLGRKLGINRPAAEEIASIARDGGMPETEIAAMLAAAENV